MTPLKSQQLNIPKYEKRSIIAGGGVIAHMHEQYRVKWYYDISKTLITENQKTLSENEYLHVEALLNDNSRIQVHSLGYYDPNMITIKGIDSAGNEVIAMLPQYNTQILITKKTVEKGKEKPAIAFHENGG
jgi:hypothetical protein